jgi:hypothetical protein
MATPRKIRIVYVTSNKFKREENEAFIRECTLANGARVEDLFEFDIRPVPIQEILNVDLSVMVSAEVVSSLQPIKSSVHRRTRGTGLF